MSQDGLSTFMGGFQGKKGTGRRRGVNSLDQETLQMETDQISYTVYA
jgi:hypothetical protein